MSAENDAPPTPSAAAASELLNRRTPPTVTVRRRILTPDQGETGVMERSGPLGNVPPWKRTTPESEADAS